MVTSRSKRVLRMLARRRCRGKSTMRRSHSLRWMRSQQQRGARRRGSAVAQAARTAARGAGARIAGGRPSLQDRGTPELKRTRSQPGQPCHAEESR